MAAGQETLGNGAVRGGDDAGFFALFLGRHFAVSAVKDSFTSV